MVLKFAINWFKMNSAWIKEFPDQERRHVVFYDQLINNTRNELEEVMRFIGFPFNDGVMKCTLANSEGPFKRQKENFNMPFNNKSMAYMKIVKEKIIKMLKHKTLSNA